METFGSIREFCSTGIIATIRLYHQVLSCFRISTPFRLAVALRRSKHSSPPARLSIPAILKKPFIAPEIITGLRLFCDKNGIPKLSLLNRCEGGLGHLLGSAEIEPRQFNLLETRHDFSGHQLGLDLMHHFYKRLGRAILNAPARNPRREITQCNSLPAARRRCGAIQASKPPSSFGSSEPRVKIAHQYGER
jgi:hypothetical protein